MKSFKLGLPSLFGRQKSAAVVQNTSVKKEVLTRNPTLPSKELEVGRMEVVMEKENLEEISKIWRLKCKMKGKLPETVVTQVLEFSPRC